MNIFFLHGKMSTPETSQTAKAVREYFEALGHTVYVPDYGPQYTAYEYIRPSLINYIADRISVTEKTVIIGISLGGFWALEMANAFATASCILLNPALHYYERPVVAREGLPLSIFLNMDDEILPSERMFNEMKYRAMVRTYPVGGHRMNNINEILPEIERAANNSGETI